MSGNLQIKILRLSEIVDEDYHFDYIYISISKRKGEDAHLDMMKHSAVRHWH